MVSVRHGSKLPGRSLARTPQTYVACNTSPDHACADVFALAVSQQHRELSRDYATFIEGFIRSASTDFTGGYALYAVDPGNAERLWNVSLKLIA